MELEKTVCPLDCWDMCGIVATVAGTRVIRLDGDPEDPVARGKLCSRTYRYPDRAQSAERILQPMRRQPDGGWRAVSWDEALGEIAGRLDDLRRRQCTHSLLHVQSAGSMGVLKTLSARFWNLYGGVSVAEGDFCLGAGKTALTAQLGDYRSHDWDDLRNSRLILLWGRDPFVSGPHRLHALREAQKHGAKIVSINPLVLSRSSIVDESIIVRPGSDGFLAAGLLRVLIEEERLDRAFLEAHTRDYEAFAQAVRQLDPTRLAAACGLASKEVTRLAHRYADAKPAAILLGTGVIRYRHGLETAGLITALPALAGTYGVPGGGLSYTVRHLRDSAVDRETSPGRGASRPFSAGVWHHQIDRLGPGSPPIEMLWVNGANPVTMLPDSAHMAEVLAKIPCKVVVDFHWTDTARLADWVLPHPSFLEEDGVVSSWGTPFVGYQRAVIPRMGESRTDLEIFQDLAQRLGFGEAMKGTAEDWSRRLLGPALDSGQWAEMLEQRRKVRNRVHEEVPWTGGRFATTDERYRFPAPDALPRHEDLPQTSSAFPFVLLSPKSRERHLSQESPKDQREMLRGTMASDVAASVPRPEGPVRIVSKHGEIRAWLRADSGLQPGLVLLPVGGTHARGSAVNLLIGPACARDGVTPAYFDCPVRLEPI